MFVMGVRINPMCVTIDSCDFNHSSSYIAPRNLFIDVETSLSRSFYRVFKGVIDWWHPGSSTISTCGSSRIIPFLCRLSARWCHLRRTHVAESSLTFSSASFPGRIVTLAACLCWCPCCMNLQASSQCPCCSSPLPRLSCKPWCHRPLYYQV